MCGIAGILNLSSVRRMDIEPLSAMAGSMQHRGPDAAGIYLDDHAALVSARLAVIDLPGGNQPLHNEDESLWMVYNGEVYNHAELRHALERRGHHFATNTDTEVVLHLFEEKGERALDDLNGQFAFAIWNARTRELFLARDRVGVRPLHYAVHQGRLFFASEIRTIFTADETIPRTLDPTGLDQVFTLWTTLPGKTVFSGVDELQPGHFMRVSGEGVSVSKWWELPFYPRDECVGSSVREISETVRALLSDAVALRLRADVPVGAYLSGGLDSSGVCALAARNKANLRTFGINFQETSFDEGEFQRVMVDHLGVRHEEICATNERIGSHFARVVWHCEKPLLRTAPVPLYLLAKRVREAGIKVVLTGEGADEFFGGYDIFKEAAVRRFWARRPASSVRPALLSTLYADIFRDDRARRMLPTFFARGLADVNNPLYSHEVRWRNTGRITALFSRDLRDRIGSYHPLDELRGILPPSFGRLDGLARAQYLEARIFLSAYLLASQGDRVGMAHSIEVRMPYLDHRLMEYMGRVPSHWKILGLDEKHILKKALGGLLPESILARTKHPYRAPIGESLLHGAGACLLGEYCSRKAIEREGLFDWPRTEMLLEKSRRGAGVGEVEGMALAGILSTQILACQYGAGFASPATNPAALSVLIDRRSL